MKYFYCRAPQLMAGATVTVEETSDFNEAFKPSNFILGTVNTATDPNEEEDESLAELQTLRGPFFLATVVDGMQGDALVPCVVNAENVDLCLKGRGGNAELIFGGNLRFQLAEPYGQIADELYGVKDVGADGE